MSKSHTKLIAVLFATTLASTAMIATASAAGSDDQALDEWMSKAEIALDENMTYPRDAQRKRQGGVARVNVTIDRTGEITSYDITKSTGSRLLDREVEATIERIGAFPAPEFNNSETTTLKVSMNYLMAYSASDYVALTRQLENKGHVTTRRVASRRGAPVVASIEIVSSDEG